jgi:hypothetical protein
MPDASENHSETGSVGGSYDFVVAYRTTRLDHCRCACLGRGEQTIGEWEKGV